MKPSLRGGVLSVLMPENKVTSFSSVRDSCRTRRTGLDETSAEVNAAATGRGVRTATINSFIVSVVSEEGSNSNTLEESLLRYRLERLNSLISV